MSIERHHGEVSERTEQTHIQLPAPTFWPMILAFGITLLFAGLVTYWAVSAVGFIIAFTGVIRWWHNVIPVEEHELVEIEEAHRPEPILAEARSVLRLQAGEHGHRVHIPEQVHPYSAGLKAGIAGGVAMAILACLYGLIVEHSIWYPVNLLAGVVIPGLGNASLAQLRSFDALAFV